MSNPAVLNAVCYSAESVFGETTTTATTLRLNIAAPVDTSGLKQDMIDPGLQKQRLMDGTTWIRGSMGGTFKTKLWLAGHGSSTSGATSIGLHETLIANYVLGSAGAAAVSAASGTTTTGGTAAVWTTTASGTFAAGSLCRLGALGDTKGGGQFYAVGTHVTTSLTPLNQPPLAPANSDVLYSAVTGYLNSTTVAVTGLRFLLQNKNIQYLCHGCAPTAASWGGFGIGQAPYVEVTWETSWWEYSASTFPSTVTTETFTPVPCGGNTFWMNDVGTATNTSGAAYRTVRDFTIDHKIDMHMLPGTGGVNAYQKYVGAIRGPDEVTISWVEDADATTTTPVMPGKADAGTAQHVMYTCSSVAGKAMGFYFPNLCFDSKPVQMNDNNINRFKITMKAYTGPTTTNELTSSGMRVGWA
jgi:hypothetical protein